MCRISNQKKKSRFICLKCGKENKVGDGIYRRSQRERYHVKDLYCVECKDTTKNVEIRYCDCLQDIALKIPELQKVYY